jgi:hypothetical protein
MYTVKRSSPTTTFICYSGFRFRWAAALVSLFHNLFEYDRRVLFFVDAEQ